MACRATVWAGAEADGSSVTEGHRTALAAIREARGKRDGSFEQAVTATSAHVFEHRGRLNDHVAQARLAGRPG